MRGFYFISAAKQTRKYFCAFLWLSQCSAVEEDHCAVEISIPSRSEPRNDFAAFRGLTETREGTCVEVAFLMVFGDS